MGQVLLSQVIPDVAARYDLVGMDPRFVGRSTPLNCRWTTDTFLRSAGPTRRSFDDNTVLQKDLAAGCAAGNRDMLPYASTRNTARDMDVIRAALGETRLSYFGVSYGTYLGAVYLQMFGARADRVVLDSAVDPNAYGPGLFSRVGPAAAAALVEGRVLDGVGGLELRVLVPVARCAAGGQILLQHGVVIETTPRRPGRP
ncbi:alpha/beta fold hydrolase, partial [Kibdelosporangium lantanae]